ncbi:MAG: TusE/DsrC/DsvC family sulfur relay protein [Cellvibrionales bacterium]|nr:TusE/DsrC/DsvC family sulfur relay protein [Cellvibrionales bacterium]
MTAIKLDQEGFLIDLTQWSESIGEEIASNENLTLTEEHWELIHLARRYHETFNLSPEMRPFIRWLKQQLPNKTISSMYLLTLFPDSPAKLISKIAGLPKPTNCL